MTPAAIFGTILRMVTRFITGLFSRRPPEEDEEETQKQLTALRSRFDEDDFLNRVLPQNTTHTRATFAAATPSPVADTSSHIGAAGGGARAASQQVVRQAGGVGEIPNSIFANTSREFVRRNLEHFPGVVHLPPNSFNSAWGNPDEHAIQAATALLFAHIANSEDPNLNLRVVPVYDRDQQFHQTFGIPVASLAPGKHRFVAYNGVHHTACDIQVGEDGKKSAIVLDAAGDPRGERLLPYFLKKNGIDDVVVVVKDGHVERVQNDTFSCPIFALDHAIQIAQIQDAHTHFRELAARNPFSEEQARAMSDYSEGYTSVSPATPNSFVTWSQVPPNLVRNIQSMKGFRQYREAHAQLLGDDINKQEYFRDLDAYVQAGTIVDAEGKEKNNSIVHHVRDQFVRKAQQLLGDENP